MELTGWWTRDEEGYMEFETNQLQRLYEAITDQYHATYQDCLYAAGEDEEQAFDLALEKGYEMVTNTKLIQGQEEFATTYQTPSFVLDIWYDQDACTQKRIFSRGRLQVLRK